MTEHRARGGNQLDIVLGEPDPVPERQALAEKAQVMEKAHRRGAGATKSAFLLKGGFQQMHVHAYAVLLRILMQRLQRPIRTPVQIRRGQLDAAQPVAVPAFPEVGKNIEIFLVRYGLVVQLGGQKRRYVWRQAGEKIAIRLVDEPVLIP